jgi:hypothetical protein
MGADETLQAFAQASRVIEVMDKFPGDPQIMTSSAWVVSFVASHGAGRLLPTRATAVVPSAVVAADDELAGALAGGGLVELVLKGLSHSAVADDPDAWIALTQLLVTILKQGECLEPYRCACLTRTVPDTTPPGPERDALYANVAEALLARMELHSALPDAALDAGVVLLIVTADGTVGRARRRERDGERSRPQAPSLPERWL